MPLSRRSNDDLEGIFLARPPQLEGEKRLAVKDLFDTEGLTTTYGSVIFRDHVPTRTAEAVRRLEDSGYQSVGKTNLHEFAYGVTSQNPHFGTVPNPRAKGHIAGGSSGGSAAALVAGLADAALGTDSGGSIRIPAACCGIVGFKPTYGLVSTDGCFPLAASFDHAGPMARSVPECAAMMEALVPGIGRRWLENVEQVEVGVAWLEHCDPLVRVRVEDAAAHFPNQRRINLPEPEGIGAVFMREVAAVHGDLFVERESWYGSNVREKVRRCLEVTDADYEAGVRRRNEYHERWLEAVGDVDLVLTPTVGFVAPPDVPDADERFRPGLIRFVYPFNIVGWPALALPCGQAEDGLPASVQLGGHPGDDALVLAAGELLQRALREDGAIP